MDGVGEVATQGTVREIKVATQGTVRRGIFPTIGRVG